MTEGDTTEQTIKETERRFVEEVWNGRQYDRIAEMHTEDFLGHWFDPEQDPTDLAGLERFIKTAHEGFSDFEMTIEFMHVDESTVTAGFTVTGTHDGEYMGIPATDEPGDTRGIWVHRYEDGKIAEAWAAWDALGQLQQLGVIPEQFSLASFLETGASLATRGILKRSHSD
ncbi:ester cyclase [Halodesulfurarchaeum sp. HSR-GB]|uniref:ester cyclase n=1 Tax=Halodesulfurarchaeum sp. HSR-GB TaxID=3074077 RepID=UPI00285B4151|nr:ester cyclase [Halodesulfurarchaeum sp. HSR-GB]MDR5655810.1 ester cyclase [Halodesulfurarchaeum sp. HSR-GB]